MKGAQEMARKRWKGTTKEERSEHAKAMAAARKTTPKRRSEIARAAAAARWGKKE